MAMLLYPRKILKKNRDVRVGAADGNVPQDPKNTKNPQKILS